MQRIGLCSFTMASFLEKELERLGVSGCLGGQATRFLPCLVAIHSLPSFDLGISGTPVTFVERRRPYLLGFKAKKKMRIRGSGMII